MNGSRRRIRRPTTPDLLTAGAEDESGGDDDHDLVAETAEGLFGRNDPGDHSGEQGQERHQVVPEAAPDEQRHHAEEDDKGDPLIERHRGPEARPRSVV